MDLIRELKDVRFELNLRGYDCDAVDAFLAKVRAEVAEVQGQREAAASRVSALEEQLAGGESDTEGTLRRTLVLAQRLADETVADARSSANELVETATAEAEQTRSSAQAEADRLLGTANTEAADVLAAAEAERTAASEDAERVAATAEQEANRTRSIASDEAERLLAEAERAGAARVEALESTARDEVARMREPIREEIRQLEETRDQLRSDIDALEAHLTEERIRVRKAVEALREGMSGSIDDLARVAADDELLTASARPPLSGAAGADVAAAADIDVAESVQRTATPAPTVEQLEGRAKAEAEHAAPATPVVEETDVIEHRPAHAPAHAAVVPDDEPAAPLDAVDAGPATEPIPVVEPATDGIADAAPAVVDLDQAPSALFGTDVAAEAAVVEASASPVEAAPAAADAVADAVSDETEGSSEAFLQRFTAAIDELPLSD